MLEPARDAVRHASLPHACTLCGSCRDVCPVRIDLPKQLLAWRGELLHHTRERRARRVVLRLARAGLTFAPVYTVLGALARFAARTLPAAWLSLWTRGRALPPIPRRSFREELARRSRR